MELSSGRSGGLHGRELANLQRLMEERRELGLAMMLKTNVLLRKWRDENWGQRLFVPLHPYVFVNWGRHWTSEFQSAIYRSPALAARRLPAGDLHYAHDSMLVLVADPANGGWNLLSPALLFPLFSPRISPAFMCDSKQQQPLKCSQQISLQAVTDTHPSIDPPLVTQCKRRAGLLLVAV